MKRKYANLINILLTHLSKKYAHHNNHISERALFGGVGSCHNGIMFGYIYDNEFYLKGYPQYLSMFDRLRMEPLILRMGGTSKLLRYYQVTEQLWKDEQKLVEIVLMVIECSHKEILEQGKLREARIRDLPNISLTLERALFKVGIITVESFREHGAFVSYFKLKQVNKNMSDNVLFMLYSALIGEHVGTLSEEQKNKLKEEYNEYVLLQT